MVAHKNEAPVYLHAEFNVTRKNHKDFIATMREILPVIFDVYRWELMYATYPIVGNVNRFTQIWRIPDEQSVLHVMRDGAVVPGASTPQESAADGSSLQFFKLLYQKLQSIISDTTHTLSTSLPHDPTYFGYQSQTLVVDKRGEFFLIEHEKLRTDPEIVDLSGQLEQTREARRKPWEHSRAFKDCELNPVRRERRESDARFEALQTLLNQGAAVASLSEHARGQRDLLFNLAGIKPRSVFQDVDPNKARDRRKLEVLDGKVDFPEGVDALLLATPWGALYRLNARDVERIKSPILDSELAPTAKALALLVEAKVPIANVPEVRDETIGDGCMCYVINLSSFAHESSDGALNTLRERSRG